MEIKTWMLVILAIVIAGLLGWLISLFLVKGPRDSKAKLGCVWTFLLTAVVFVILKVIMPTLIVVNYEDGEYTYEKIDYIGTYVTESGITYSPRFNEVTLVNETDADLLLYPVFYGYTETPDIDPVLIDPRDIKEIKETPYYYFTKPSGTIYTKSKKEIRWALGTLDQVVQWESEGYNPWDVMRNNMLHNYPFK